MMGLAGRMASRVLLVFTLAFLLPVAALPVEVEEEQELVIETASGHEDEVEYAKVVKRLIEEHDLLAWMFTRHIVIDRETRIPHSHPVLTLNTEGIENEIDVLSDLVHEQLHWFVLKDQKALGASIKELEARYPEAPGGPPEGARDLKSTYLHLVVCSLEYLALEDKVGREKAEENLLSKPYYKWVFRTVVEDRDEIRSILEQHGLILP